MIKRRDFFVKAGAAGAAVAAAGPSARADVPTHLWSGYDFGPGPRVVDRLNQGPFGIEQDEGWYTVEATTPSDAPVRNPGLGLVGYTFEEGGPALAAREGRSTLEREVAAMAALPFADLFYIRCDWRDVQSRPGRLDLHPVFALTREAARSSGRRFGFRVQLSNTEHQPQELALPRFLRDAVPLVTIRSRSGRGSEKVEPRYDHPAFRDAFRELNELLAAEFDGDDAVEFVDLMMYGFWGEGHTGDYPSPFPDYLDRRAHDGRDGAPADRGVEARPARRQHAAGHQPRRQPRGARPGGARGLLAALGQRDPRRADPDRAAREPAAVARGDPRGRLLPPVPHGRARLPRGRRGRGRRDRADDAARARRRGELLVAVDGVREPAPLPRRPAARRSTTLQRRIGYRVRPAWVWQRKRYGTSELVVAFANDGVAGVPGVLRVFVESADGRVRVGGGLDAGHPHAGRLRQASFLLPPGLEGQKLRLRAEVEMKGGVRRPVRWACAQPLDADGSLAVELMRLDDPRWRKGI